MNAASPISGVDLTKAGVIQLSMNRFLLPLLFAVLLLSMFFSLGIGNYPLSWGKILSVLFTAKDIYPADIPEIVVKIVRLPRILLAVTAGMGLALAGAAMQGVFRNPLVGPEIVGVSAGASFGAVIGIILSFSLTGISVTAFIFGIGALTAAFMLSRLAQNSGMLGLILSGVIISAFFAALTGSAQYFADPQTKLPAIVYWLMGSFASATYAKAAFMSAVLLVAGTLLVAVSWRINLLSLGQADASALGVNVNLFRWCIVALVSVIVGAQVSVSGGVGWVGLVIPHVARMVSGPEHSRLLPVSALMGGIYLLLVDDLARSVTVQELPIGLLTAIIGSPIFAVLFIKTHNRGWSNE